MGLASDLRRFKANRVQALSRQIVAETVREFGSSLVTEWSPIGEPETWKAPPPADYRPGNFRSSWFLSVGAPTGETTEATDQREVHHLDLLNGLKVGETVHLCNSAPHASSLEYAHSAQAPAGIMVNAIEFEPLAYNVARRAAG
jgi:hypothetical protein